jgi:hypothetical protein
MLCILVEKYRHVKNPAGFNLAVKEYCLEEKAAGFEETSSFIYQTAWRHKPEDNGPKFFLG